MKTIIIMKAVINFFISAKLVDYCNLVKVLSPFFNFICWLWKLRKRRRRTIGRKISNYCENSSRSVYSSENLLRRNKDFKKVEK
jgi:hypothetical protein